MAISVTTVPGGSVVTVNNSGTPLRIGLTRTDLARPASELAASILTACSSTRARVAAAQRERLSAAGLSAARLDAILGAAPGGADATGSAADDPRWLRRV